MIAVELRYSDRWEKTATFFSVPNVGDKIDVVDPRDDKTYSYVVKSVGWREHPDKPDWVRFTPFVELKYE